MKKENLVNFFFKNNPILTKVKFFSFKIKITFVKSYKKIHIWNDKSKNYKKKILKFNILI